MGKIDFNTFKEVSQNVQDNDGKPRVTYFYLKNDKDTAIVRFLVDSIDELNIIALHRVMINGKQRSVSCGRDARDPVSDCPLCAAGEKLNYRIFVPVIVYERDDQGNIVAVPKIWERSTYYLNTFSNLLESYGPLSDSIFKVVRNGTGINTTYDIVYGLPSIYKDELYPKKTELFKGYDVMDGAVLELNKADLQTLAEGGTPASLMPRSAASANNYDEDDSAPVDTSSPVPKPMDTSSSASAPSYRQNTAASAYGNNAAQNAARPRRYY